jgi:adenylate cyclase
MLDAVIRKHGGVVDKYLGDGLMAQWGAPAIPGEALLAGHAEAALRACLEIQREAELLAVQEAASASSVGFELRLTLHTGPVVFGWVGAKRLELTIIGDTVNVTSRLQETAKQLGVDFLVSESTYARVREHVTTGQEAEVEIRGRDRPLRVYEIVGEKG